MTVPFAVVHLAHLTGDLALRIAEFLDAYEFEGTDANGRPARYAPDHAELALLNDCLAQFIADPETVAILTRYAEARAAAERERLSRGFGPALP